MSGRFTIDFPADIWIEQRGLWVNVNDTLVAAGHAGNASLTQRRVHVTACPFALNHGSMQPSPSNSTC